MGIPSADALSIVLPGRSSDGTANATRINILEGNVFNPQFAITGGNTSNNNTIGNVFMNLGNNILNKLLSFELNFAGTVGNGNTTQINILSYNIFNPQISLFGPNISNNTTVNNVAMNNGNNSSASVSNDSGLPLIGAMGGNGNAVQFSFLSGNIFNPQISFFGGGNVSYNTAVTNVAMNNGNFSGATLAWGGWFATFLFGGGNGNTVQFGFFVSNIWNPQISFGGGNVSYNTAVTNDANGNGNNSTTNASGGIIVGTTGNGNTNQGAIGSGNIWNDQINIGPGNQTVVTTPPPDPIEQLLNSQTTNATGDPDNSASLMAARQTGDDPETSTDTDTLTDLDFKIDDDGIGSLNGRSTSRIKAGNHVDDEPTKAGGSATTPTGGSGPETGTEPENTTPTTETENTPGGDAGSEGGGDGSGN
ncbi:hypothetical protein [Mycolicibacterium phlei]|uniref:hypothetical protein n=1 Tax=Mycolicibacterium phlei TaxID=1771 RepID=UPI00025AEEB6|nr:hypothetical protein [Mycolicibacterium phlei]EID12974.1 hypothetical protein MPHLEI_14836 [Mycolicibacterium phlei RIVM601174]MBF4191339.1 hypothetical protein [Mycolicibacterium phlei]